jgi:galactokinase
MKVKNSQLVDFNQLAVGNKKLPAKLAYAIAVNTTAARGAIETYFEQRRKKVEDCANKDKDGAPIVKDDGNYDIPDEKMAALNDELKELLEMEVEVPITTVPFKVIEKCDHDEFESLTPAELFILQFMIED